MYFPPYIHCIHMAKRPPERQYVNIMSAVRRLHMISKFTVCCHSIIFRSCINVGQVNLAIIHLAWVIPVWITVLFLQVILLVAGLAFSLIFTCEQPSLDTSSTVQIKPAEEAFQISVVYLRYLQHRPPALCLYVITGDFSNNEAYTKS